MDSEEKPWLISEECQELGKVEGQHSVINPQTPP